MTFSKPCCFLDEVGQSKSSVEAVPIGLYAFAQ